VITRRQILTSSIAAAGVGALSRIGRGQDQKAGADAPAGAPNPDRILVVVQLSGGNDGLNTVVPWADDLYHKARPTLRIEPEKTLKLDDHVGLHPGMKALHKRFGEGHVAVVQGVGYPNANRSHFRSMEIWHTAEPESTVAHAGWIGRCADCVDASVSKPALIVNLGAMAPFALHRAQAPVLAFENEEAFSLAPDRRFPKSKDALAAAFRKLCAPVAKEPVADVSGASAASAASMASARSTSSYAQVVRATAASAMASADEVLTKVSKTKSDANYPRGGGGLGQRLSLIARMIAGGMSTRVYYAQLGGFDTHARQRDAHANLLTHFSDAVDAFFDDLEKLGRAKDVVLVSFSEFGRRVDENGSAGTDHGTAGPMFVVGPSVRGGLYGAPPDLGNLVDQDPVFGVDFRRVYATLLRGWLDVAPVPVLGGEFATLPILT
jgi:uncharacterized protein (DUF1501 family)